MANTNNVVELNGKYFDEASGALLPAEGVAPQHVASMRRVEVVKRPVGNHVVKSMDIHVPRATKPLTPHQPAKSSTLMRHAVKQPASAVQANVKAQAPLDGVMVRRLQKLPAIVPKATVRHIPLARAQRARHAARSDVVQRFTKPVAPPAVAAAYIPSSERPVVNSHAQPEAVRPQLSAAPASTGIDVFSQALAAAAEHKEHAVKPHHQPLKTKNHAGNRTKKLAYTGLMVAGITALGAFVYLNKPVLEMKLASMRSGISASLPDYQPAGFGVSKLDYAPGAVKVAFNGPSGKNFSIDQKQSNWDSDTLMDNFVATSDKSYNAYQANGRTVFIYGQGKATWVNGGIWYQLTSSGLSDDEMLKVAATM